jgi:tetratricopeptide (TPR) repeat protein
MAGAAEARDVVTGAAIDGMLGTQGEPLRTPHYARYQHGDASEIVGVYIAVLGRADISFSGVQRYLPPLTLKLLLRLVAAEGQALSAEEVYRDVWDAVPADRIDRPARSTLQRRIARLRALIDPERTSVLRTEQLLVAGKPRSCYRLVLNRPQVDYREFEHLVHQAGNAAPGPAVALLTQALGLWRGEPLADLANLQFSSSLVRRLLTKCETAVKDLARLYSELGQPELALSVTEQLAEVLPADDNIAGTLRSLRARLRAHRFLDTAQQWELSPERWERIAAILESLAIYLAQDDMDAFDQAASQLERAGPVRSARIGAEHLTPPSPPARDRMYQLIHGDRGQPEDTT